MKVAVMFLIGFLVGFAVICGGSTIFGYGLDGVAAFVGSFAVASVTATIAANN